MAGSHRRLLRPASTTPERFPTWGRWELAGRFCPERETESGQAVAGCRAGGGEQAMPESGVLAPLSGRISPTSPELGIPWPQEDVVWGFRNLYGESTSSSGTSPLRDAQPCQHRWELGHLDPLPDLAIYGAAVGAAVSGGSPALKDSLDEGFRPGEAPACWLCLRLSLPTSGPGPAEASAPVPGHGE